MNAIELKTWIGYPMNHTQDLDHGNEWYAHHDWMNLNGPKTNEWTIKNGNDHMRWTNGIMGLEMDPIEPMETPDEPITISIE